ncbi:MAG: SMC-Scp complex subunit ScpB [Methylococcaceae bacterium]|nr:SMC-Scp complex subunit ScpB [Methylococcaceae bacterium]
MNIKKIVEAVLFASDKPLSLKQLQAIFPELQQPDIKALEVAVAEVMQDYHDRPVELKAVASGYRFQVTQEMSPWVSRLFDEKPPRYSRALLETLAIIAYRQPVTRGEIEDIRGVVVSSNIIRTLLEREWIKVVAHKEVPGRPALYASTQQFLDYFNLTSLGQLPTLQEIQELNKPLKDNEQPTQADREQQEINTQPLQETASIETENDT